MDAIFRMLSLSPTNSPVEELARRYRERRLNLDPSYQRGFVWNYERQQNLIKSLTMGLPIGAIYLNERDIMQPDVVVDGKQRIHTIAVWLGGMLTVPAAWFPPEMVLPARRIRQGVTYADLTLSGQRMWRNNATVTVYRTRYTGSDAEARERELFDLVNFGGVPQGESGADAVFVEGLS